MVATNTADAKIDARASVPSETVALNTDGATNALSNPLLFSATETLNPAFELGVSRPVELSKTAALNTEGTTNALSSPLHSSFTTAFPIKPLTTTSSMLNDSAIATAKSTLALTKSSVVDASITALSKTANAAKTSAPPTASAMFVANATNAETISEVSAPSVITAPKLDGATNTLSAPPPVSATTGVNVAKADVVSDADATSAMSLLKTAPVALRAAKGAAAKGVSANTVYAASRLKV